MAAGAGAPSSISRPLLTDFAQKCPLMYDDTAADLGSFHTNASSAIEVYYHRTLTAFS